MVPISSCFEDNALMDVSTKKSAWFIGELIIIIVVIIAIFIIILITENV